MLKNSSNGSAILASDDFKALIAELIDSSSDSEDDDIFEIVNQYSDDEEFVMLNTFLQAFKGEKRNNIPNYLDEIVPSYTEEEFRHHFRISKNLYINLSERFARSDFYKNLRADKRLSAKTYLAVFLWFAGHEACSFSDLSARFHLSKSSVSRIIARTTMFISNLSPDVIKWPDEAKKQESAAFFANKSGFSKVIGCIDGTHIFIDPPTKCKDEYIDRNGNVALQMQAVCNEKKKFIHIFTGFPGSCHDSWVFKNSPLYENLGTFCGDYYLLADSAYPCSQHIVTPYKNNEHLSSAKTNFNVKLSSGRVCIEHTFGMLKQRFRQLNYCKLRGIKKLCHFIRACCVLHNMANENDLMFEEDRQEQQILDNERYVDTSSGNTIRDNICRELQLNEK